MLGFAVFISGVALLKRPQIATNFVHFTHFKGGVARPRIGTTLPSA